MGFLLENCLGLPTDQIITILVKEIANIDAYQRFCSDQCNGLKAVQGSGRLGCLDHL
jgi:hypothetical protein